MFPIRKGGGMIRVRFAAVTDHETGTRYGSRAASGETVDEAWENLCSELGISRETATYDDWKGLQ